MKKIVSLSLTMAMMVGLCLNMAVPASAVDSTILGWEKTGKPETGLTMFTEEKISPHIWSVDGKGGLDDFYGLKDALGNVVLPADYLRLEYLGPNRLLAGKPRSGLGVITLEGTIIYPFSASQIRAAEVSGSDYPLLVIGEGIDDTFGKNYGSPVDTGLYDWNVNPIIPMGTYRAIRSIGENHFLLCDKKSDLRGVYEYGIGVAVPVEERAIPPFSASKSASLT